LGVLAFLLIHIVDTALLGWGPEVFNRVMALYRHPFFRVSEIFLFASVWFHAINGVRVFLVDFWPGATKRYKTLWTWQVVIFWVVMVPAGLRMAWPLLGKGS
jgi:succinate dehydrogenase / fumarate reductase cytochrome b subunit